MSVPTATLTPVLGDVSDAFTNVSVKNSDAVTETPADLAALFPTLLNLVLPQLSGGLSPISLPKLGGLELSVDRPDRGRRQGWRRRRRLPRASSRTSCRRRWRASTSRPRSTSRRSRSPMRRSRGRLRSGADARGPAVTLSARCGRRKRGRSSSRFASTKAAGRAWSPNPRPVLSPQSVLAARRPPHRSARALGRRSRTAQTRCPRCSRCRSAPTCLPPGAVDERSRPPASTVNRARLGCACNTGGGGGAAAPFALVVLGMMLPRAAPARAQARAVCDAPRPARVADRARVLAGLQLRLQAVRRRATA